MKNLKSLGQTNERRRMEIKIQNNKYEGKQKKARKIEIRNSQ